jgi:hypothetical protein
MTKPEKDEVNIIAKERRRTERAHIYLDAQWTGQYSLSKGTISDVSEEGCFVLTSGKVKRKEIVKLKIETPTSKTLEVKGKVIYFYQEIGFGLCFTDMSETERELLALLIDYSSE